MPPGPAIYRFYSLKKGIFPSTQLCLKVLYSDLVHKGTT